MSLALRLQSEFDRNVIKRGQGYFYGRHVSFVARDQDGADFLVQGSDISPYSVRINWQPNRALELAASCNCPYSLSGDPCKHLWAVVLECDKQGFAKLVPGTQKLHLVVNADEETSDEETSDEDEYEDEYEGDELEKRLSTMLPETLERIIGKKAARLLGRNSKPVKKQRPPVPVISPWKKQLDKLKSSIHATTTATTNYQPYRTKPKENSREAWYVLDVDATMRWGQPVIVFYDRILKQNGTLGKIKKSGVDHKEIEQFNSPEDRSLMEILAGPDRYSLENVMSGWNSYNYYSSYARKQAAGTVLPHSVEEIMPKLCATNRFVWVLSTSLKPEIEIAPRLTWDAGPEWTPRIRLLHDPVKQDLRIVGELQRGDETLPLTAPSLLLQSGLMIQENRLCRWDPSGVYEWVVWLRDNLEIVVPAKDQDQFLTHLWSLPRLPAIEFPENMQWEQIRLAPAGHVRIFRPKQQTYSTRGKLYAEPAFSYGDTRVLKSKVEGAIVDSEKKQILLRDADAEQALMNQLAAIGISETYEYYGRQEASYQLAESKFSRAMDQLIDLGWSVEAEGKLIRRPGEMKLSVTSNVDWFELSAKIDFDGVNASLPALLAALRSGEKFVQLGDGTKGILPKEWLEKFGRLADLGSSEAKDEVIKFAPTQALLLDALLAAQEQDAVTVDQKFESYRKKLRSFSGVEAAKAPKTFHGELRHYQEEGLGWLDFLRDFGFGGCLADDMGLGKTIQVLAMLDGRRTRKLKADETRRPSLVVVPRSLVFNWVEEAKKFTPNLRVLDYSEKERAAARENFNEFDLIVTTYGIMRMDIAYLNEIRFDYAILDESQAIKNSASQAAKASRLIQADHRLAMTGTPVENHLGELWSLFEFLNPGMLGRSGTFQTLARATVAKPINANASVSASNTTLANADENYSADEDDRRQSLSVLASALRPFILRRTKQQVLTELPERTEQTLYCEMEPKQRKQYEELRDYYRQSLSQRVAKNGLAKSKIHVLEALLRLRQAACHPGLLDKKKIGEPSAKLDTLLDQIEELAAENHKALIFSQFTSLLDIVRQRLDQRKLTYEYLDGKTRDRQARVDRFQTDPNCPLFLISLKAGGHGLNLTAADYVFILDPWWNPAVEAQAIDRAYRMGQTRNVFAYRLICKGTVEDKILELQKSKKELAEAIVSADNSLIRSLTSEDLQLLLS